MPMALCAAAGRVYQQHSSFPVGGGASYLLASIPRTSKAAAALQLWCASGSAGIGLAAGTSQVHGAGATDCQGPIL